MEFARERELVHLRYELRRLLADGRRDEAPALLERLRQLTTEEACEACEERLSGPSLFPEIERWMSTFGL